MTSLFISKTSGGAFRDLGYHDEMWIVFYNIDMFGADDHEPFWHGTADREYDLGQWSHWNLKPLFVDRWRWRSRLMRVGKGFPRTAFWRVSYCLLSVLGKNYPRILFSLHSTYIVLGNYYFTYTVLQENYYMYTVFVKHSFRVLIVHFP